MNRLRRIAIAIVGPAVLMGTLATTPPAGAVTPSVTRDSCLTGRWVMDAETSTALLRRLAQIPGSTVTEGVISMTFRRGVQTYGSTLFVLTGSTGDGTFTSEASWINEAPYRTRNGRIITGPGTSELSFGEQTLSGPSGTFTVAGPPAKTTPIPGGATPYRCTRTTLTWPIPLGADGSTQARFRRG